MLSLLVRLTTEFETGALLAAAFFLLLDRLAVVCIGEELALLGLELHSVLIWRSTKQVHVAVGRVVMRRLTVLLAAEPPWRAVGSSPCLLRRILTVHCVVIATTA